MPNGRCRIHGGLSPKGAASGRFKTGRYSKYLPGGIADAYRRAASDRGLLSLRDDVALIEALQADALKRWQEAPGAPWGKLLKALDRVDDALRSGGDPAAALGRLRHLVAEGRDADGRGRESRAGMLDLIGQKTRTVMAAHRRMMDLSCTVTADEAMTLVTALIAAAREFIPDQATFRKLSERVLQLLPPEAP